jgi:hypothetical protein
LLSQKDAQDICEHIESVIRKNWDVVYKEAQLGEIDEKYLWNRQFLNPFSLGK